MCVRLAAHQCFDEPDQLDWPFGCNSYRNARVVEGNVGDLDTANKEWKKS